MCQLVRLKVRFTSFQALKTACNLAAPSPSYGQRKMYPKSESARRVAQVVRDQSENGSERDVMCEHRTVQSMVFTVGKPIHAKI